MKKRKPTHYAVKADTIMLEIKDLLSALDKSLKQFPDRSAKWLLENTQNLRGLLEIIASDIIEYLDFSKVEIKNTTFISDNLRQQESDLVYLLPFRDAVNTRDSTSHAATEVMIYILVEHQSTVDWTMGYRLLSYMCQIWESQRREYMARDLPQREWRFHWNSQTRRKNSCRAWQNITCNKALNKALNKGNVG